MRVRELVQLIHSCVLSSNMLRVLCSYPQTCGRTAHGTRCARNARDACVRTQEHRGPFVGGTSSPINELYV